MSSRVSPAFPGRRARVREVAAPTSGAHAGMGRMPQNALHDLERHLASVRRLGYGTSVEETERGSLRDISAANQPVTPDLGDTPEVLLQYRRHAPRGRPGRRARLHRLSQGGLAPDLVEQPLRPARPGDRQALLEQNDRRGVDTDHLEGRLRERDRGDVPGRHGADEVGDRPGRRVSGQGSREQRAELGHAQRHPRGRCWPAGRSLARYRGRRVRKRRRERRSTSGRGSQRPP
ncbi:MAG: hypothetical protein JWP40_4159 [Blastococcus sp.]|nr:hypothetical protein [Blastococcus sp.]